MTGISTRLSTLWALGFGNIARVAVYRLTLKTGIHPVQRIAATILEGDFFAPPVVPPVAAPASSHWNETALLFGSHCVPIGIEPPIWTADPLAKGRAVATPPSDLPPWWEIGDFAAGDIKRTWEYSRFDWAMIFAQRARNGDAASLRRLNEWITDWVRRNPPYRGPNWKCAQEASIRLMHLAIAALILGRERVLSDALHSLIEAHVRRILPTLSYARAQDNNHATSEAAALFIAGAWLGMADRRGSKAIHRRGRDLLERHVARLFGEDGSFSQYSLNYHRLALDTLSIAELWRQRAGLPSFSSSFYKRAAAAAQWLRAMVAPTSGDAPNLGANDGANLLPLTDAPYRDHRPSVQIACALFCRGRAYPAGPWDDALTWLGIYAREPLAPLPAAQVFDDGGYAVLRQGKAMSLLRYPRFRFRPSQADALHLDFWLDGENLLRDAGTFSYNTDPTLIDYFNGVEAHNTVQFDFAPQMPRLSRFLLSDWLVTKTRGLVKRGNTPAFYADYRSQRGWRHMREVHLDKHLHVTDRVEGFHREAKLRWRLRPGDWRIEGNCATDGYHTLAITADVPIDAITIATGFESRYYFEKSSLPVLEVTVKRPATIISEYHWMS